MSDGCNVIEVCTQECQAIEIYSNVISIGTGTGGGTTTSFYYFHDQPTASDTWVINHLLGSRPNVSAYTVGGKEVIGEVLHVSLNQSNVYFDQPFAGYAICS